MLTGQDEVIEANKIRPFPNMFSRTNRSIISLKHRKTLSHLKRKSVKETPDFREDEN